MRLFRALTPLALLLSATSFTAPALAAPDGAPSRHLTGADLFNLEVATDPQISPDGKTIAYVRKSNDIMGLWGPAKNFSISGTAKRYHQPDDEYQADWDFTGQAQDAQLLHLLGERLANSREWPNWSSDSEFRATRDQSSSERPGSGGERG